MDKIFTLCLEKTTTREAVIPVKEGIHLPSWSGTPPTRNDIQNAQIFAELALMKVGEG